MSIKPIILIYFFLGVLVFIQINSSYSLFLIHQYHLSAHKLSSLFLLNSLIIVIFQVTILKHSKAMNQLLLMCIGSLIMGFGFLTLLFGNGFIAAVISLLLWTFGEMLFMPVSQTLVYQKASDNLKGYYMGIYQALFSIAVMVSPLFGSFALHINSNGILLWLSCFILCALPIVTYPYLGKKFAQ